MYKTNPKLILKISHNPQN